MKSYIILTFAAFLPGYLATSNWCGLESCQDREHVDCTMSSGAFGTVCPDNAVMLNLAPDQDRILHQMNSYRNKVAGGLVPNKYAAKRMATLGWNVTLANLARKNVKKCTFTQDECMNTPDYDFVGQNIARSTAPLNDRRTNSERISELIDLWFSENTNATMDDIRQFPPQRPNGKKIANFTQLVRDYATLVGCGALSYQKGNNHIILFTCNFNMENMVDWPVYVDGPAGIDCKTGRNPNYPNLCSTGEAYNVNHFWEDFE